MLRDLYSFIIHVLAMVDLRFRRCGLEPGDRARRCEFRCRRETRLWRSVPRPSKACSSDCDTEELLGGGSPRRFRSVQARAEEKLRMLESGKDVDLER